MSAPRLTLPKIYDLSDPRSPLPERGELIAIAPGNAVGLWVGRTPQGLDWVAYTADDYASMVARFDLLADREAIKNKESATRKSLVALFEACEAYITAKERRLNVTEEGGLLRKALLQAKETCGDPAPLVTCHNSDCRRQFHRHQLKLAEGETDFYVCPICHTESVWI